MNLQIDLVRSDPIGEVAGVKFYRLPVVVAVADDQVVSVATLAEWERSIAAEALALRAEVTRLRGQLRQRASNGRALRKTPDPAPAPAPPEPTPPVAEPTPPVTEPTYPCATCGRVYASVRDFNRHVCKPLDPTVEAPARTLIIPDDPIEREAELQRRLTARWPRPCPECWRQGRVELLRGKQAWDAHRHSAHDIRVVQPFVPIPVASLGGWQCQVCRSGAYAESVRQAGVCTRCAALALAKEHA